MQNTRIRTTGVGLAAAFGAGLAAALFALMPTLKSPDGLTAIGDLGSSGSAAWLMAFIAPLPVMLASLAFGSLAGLVAALVGALAVGIVDMQLGMVAVLHLDKIASGGLRTLSFAVALGIPAWLLTRLAVMPSAVRRADGKMLARPDERRLGSVIAVAVVFAAIGALLDIAIAADAQGWLRGMLEQSATALEPMLTRRGPLPSGVDPHALALAFVWTAMAIIVAAAELMRLTFDLWIAARIAQLSGLLSAPWPDIPSGLRVPRPLAIVLAVALGLSFAGGRIGIAGVIVSGALGTAFAFQGLAVIHALTRSKQGLRLPLLIIVYLLLVMLMPWSLAAYGLFGLVDAAFSFRDRQKPFVKKTQ